MTPIQKLEKHFLSGGDIGIPVSSSDYWVLLDSDDEEISFGISLEEAVGGINPPTTPSVESENKLETEKIQLRAKLAGAEIEIDRLKAEVQAARMILKKWLENIEELKEATKFLSR